jgi:hypothetical protein
MSLPVIEKVIYVQDGDLVYEISSKDMAYFKRLCEMKKKEADHLKTRESMTGVFKHLHY